MFHAMLQSCSSMLTGVIVVGQPLSGQFSSDWPVTSCAAQQTYSTAHTQREGASVMEEKESATTHVGVNLRLRLPTRALEVVEFGYKLACQHFCQLLPIVLFTATFLIITGVLFTVVPYYTTNNQVVLTVLELIGALIELLIVQIGELCLLVAAIEIIHRRPVTTSSIIYKSFHELCPNLATTLINRFVVFMGLCFCIVPGFVFWVLFILQPMATVVEGEWGCSGISRSMELGKGHHMRNFVVMFLTGLVPLLMLTLVVTVSALLAGGVLASVGFIISLIIIGTTSWAATQFCVATLYYITTDAPRSDPEYTPLNTVVEDME